MQRPSANGVSALFESSRRLCYYVTIENPPEPLGEGQAPGEP